MRFNHEFHYRLITLINLTKGKEEEVGRVGGQSTVTDVKQRKLEKNCKIEEEIEEDRT